MHVASPTCTTCTRVMTVIDHHRSSCSCINLSPFQFRSNLTLCLSLDWGALGSFGEEHSSWKLEYLSSALQNHTSSPATPMNLILSRRTITTSTVNDYLNNYSLLSTDCHTPLTQKEMIPWENQVLNTFNFHLISEKTCLLHRTVKRPFKFHTIFLFSRMKQMQHLTA